MAERNMKRTSAEPGDVVVVRDPTVNAAGTLLLDSFLPGGTGGNAGGGFLGLRANSEFILDPDKTYMVRLTNRAGTAQPASLLIQWYEESDN
jgi:signal peptidase I